MFARFTDRAGKVMALANQEAHRFDHEYIGTEHILLGLLEEGSGVGANVLKILDVDLRKVRLEVEKLVKRGSAPVTIGKLPQTPAARAVIQFAIEEARNLGHNYVGTEHLLLGLLRQEDGLGRQILMNLGINIEQARQEVLSLLGAAAPNEDGALSPAPPPEPAEGPGAKPLQQLAALLMGFENECERLLVAKDAAVKGADYERAADLRDQAERVRLAMQEILGELEQLCQKAETTLADLREQ